MAVEFITDILWISSSPNYYSCGRNAFFRLFLLLCILLHAKNRVGNISI